MRQKRLDLLCLYPHSLGGIIVKRASLRNILGFDPRTCTARGVWGHSKERPGISVFWNAPLWSRHRVLGQLCRELY